MRLSIIRNHLADMRQTLDWILPPVCPASGELVPGHGMVAPEIWQALTFISNPKCHQCGLPFEYQVQAKQELCFECEESPKPYNQARSALIYNDQSRDLILKYKHGDKTQALAVFLPWLIKAGDSFWDRTDLMISVPLHPYRLIKRRYNQSALLVNALSKALAIPCNHSDLYRTRHTKTQGHLNAKQRSDNIRGAFALRQKHRIEGKHIVLVDDVLTSGATVEACAKTLLSGGAAEVNVLTLARAVKGGPFPGASKSAVPKDDPIKTETQPA